MSDPAPRIRRGPSVSEIAALAGVGTATVDRVLNGRAHVADATAARVIAALTQLQAPRRAAPRRVAILCESGESFNTALREAADTLARRRPDLNFRVETHASVDMRPLALARQIERMAEESDGLILVVREDPTIQRAARAVKRRGVPVVCLATDLPAGCRHAFVGSDEDSAGAAAAGLFGDLRPAGGAILLLTCGDYHAAKDREAGFLRVLALHPALRVARRVEVDNGPERARAAVLAEIAAAGPPAGIYSIAGGNRGVGAALRESGLAGRVAFIGHELNRHSRDLLLSGAMTYLIARDQVQELTQGVAVLDAIAAGYPHLTRDTCSVRILSAHLCRAG